MLKIPGLFFKSKVLICDDDQHFARMLKMVLGENISIETISNPKEIDNYILENKDIIKDKKELISILVIDQHLNDELGTDILCKYINYPFKKILMSNFLDADTVNEAYKQRLIDAFLQKMDNAFISKLKDIILRLQKEYFLEYTEKNLQNNTQKNLLRDDLFSVYFYSLVEKFKIQEFYLNKSGNIFYMKSSLNNEDYILQIFYDQDFSDLLESIQAEKAPPLILERINKRKAIPCFLDGEISDGLSWSESMKQVHLVNPAQKIYTSFYPKDEDTAFHAT